MNNKTVKNYMFNLLYQVLIVVTPLITTPYVSRILTPNGVGIYSSCYGVAAIFTAFGLLGILNYGAKRIAIFQNDKERLSKEFWSIWSIQVISSLLSLGVYIGICFSYAEQRDYYLLLIPLVLSSLFDISWLFMGLEDLKKTVLRNSIVKLLFVVSLFLFVKTAEDLKVYFIIQSASYFLGYSVLWFCLKGKVNWVPINLWKPRKHILEVLMLFIPVIAIQLTSSFDRTMVEKLSNYTETGFYDQAIKMTRIVTPFLTSLSYALLPRIAGLSANNETKEITKNIKYSFDFTFFFSILGAGLLFIIAPVFVPLFFGEEYLQIVKPVQISCVLIVAIPIGGVFANQLALPLGKNVLYTIPVYVTVVVDFLLIFILVPKYGALGGVIAITVAETITAALRIIFMKNTVPLREIFGKIYQYILIFAITFFISFITFQFLDSRINGIIMIGLVGLIYVLLAGILTIIVQPLIYKEIIRFLKGVVAKRKLKS